MAVLLPFLHEFVHAPKNSAGPSDNATTNNTRASVSASLSIKVTGPPRRSSTLERSSGLIRSHAMGLYFDGRLLQEFLQQELSLPRAGGTNIFVITLDDATRRDQGRVAEMEASSNTASITIAPGVREVTSEDGAVLLDVEQGVCFSLNPVGLKIWELLKKECSLEQIVDALEQEFSVPRPQILADAAQFIMALEAKQLIRRPCQNPPQKPSFFGRLLRRKERFSAH